jgi:substrate import-associated zinc metallohydrolase lipoprotein
MAVCTASCDEDTKFTDSIFDTSVETIDQDASTAPFDQWLYDNFVTPYNTEIQYKFNFPASNMSFQLAPAEYEKSQLLANFIKYLFYDVYTLHGSENFMKLYGPRMFHFIGSAAFSPTTGTETLGYASAGVKITLINVNSLKMWSPSNLYSPTDIDELNRQQFHTMHHEFSHILHQTKSYPVSFGQVTPGSYDGRNWQDRDSVESHRLGFITQYGSSATYEDFVETLSCTITDTDERWMNTIIDACLNGGVREGDKEQIYQLIENLEIEGLDDPSKPWNKFTVYKESMQNKNTKNYEETGRLVPSFHQADTKAQTDETLKFEKVAEYTSFREFLNGVELDTSDFDGGINAILKKIDIAKKWYSEKWGLDLYAIRREVRERQNRINEYVKENVTIYDYQ